MMILLVGGLYGASIKMMKLMSLPMAIGYCLVQNVNLILEKYILWIDSIYVTDPSCYLHSPFNFDLYSDIIIVKQYLTLTHWEYLLTICTTFIIVPPILSTLTDVKGSNK